MDSYHQVVEFFCCNFYSCSLANYVFLLLQPLFSHLIGWSAKEMLLT